MIYSWRGGIEERFRFFLSAGDERTHSLRAGMRSQTVCEKWEAKRTDLFNELRRFHTKRKETHDTKMKTKISKYQKLKTKKKTKKQTTNGEKSFSSQRLSDLPGSAHDSILRHATHLRQDFHSSHPQLQIYRSSIFLLFSIHCISCQS